MPLFQVDIEKSIVRNQAQTIYWTNVYHVDAVDMAAAVANGAIIANWERAITYASVAFTKMRTRLAGSTGEGTLTTLTGNGSRSASGVTLLPLFDVVRVDFTVGLGRPSRKYLRGCLAEVDIDGDVLTSTMLTLVSNSYATPLTDSTWYVDVDGQAITGFAVLTPVAMRQLRRGSKRKVAPVL